MQRCSCPWTVLLYAFAGCWPHHQFPEALGLSTQVPLKAAEKNEEERAKAAGSPFLDHLTAVSLDLICKVGTVTSTRVSLLFLAFYFNVFDFLGT